MMNFYLFPHCLIRKRKHPTNLFMENACNIFAIPCGFFASLQDDGMKWFQTKYDGILLNWARFFSHEATKHGRTLEPKAVLESWNKEGWAVHGCRKKGSGTQPLKWGFEGYLDEKFVQFFFVKLILLIWSGFWIFIVFFMVDLIQKV